MKERFPAEKVFKLGTQRSLPLEKRDLYGFRALDIVQMRAIVKSLGIPAIGTSSSAPYWVANRQNEGKDKTANDLADSRCTWHCYSGHTYRFIDEKMLLIQLMSLAYPCRQHITFQEEEGQHCNVILLFLGFCHPEVGLSAVEQPIIWLPRWCTQQRLYESNLPPCPQQLTVRSTTYQQARRENGFALFAFIDLQCADLAVDLAQRVYRHRDTTLKGRGHGGRAARRRLVAMLHDASRKSRHFWHRRGGFG